MKGTYDIMYNETRLFLQIYTSYVANSGYMNLLQYVHLEDLPMIHTLTIPLTEIVNKFEEVFEKFSQVRTWDLESNLLTCYLLLLESTDEYRLNAGDLIRLAKKFIELALHSLDFQVIELQKFESTESEDERAVNEEPNDSQPSDDMVDYMEQADQITLETISEVLVGGFKFVQVLMEIIVESRLGIARDVALTPMEANRVEDLIISFTHQLNNRYAAICSSFKLEEEELAVVLEINKGIEIVSHGDLTAIEPYITDSFTDINIHLLLGKVDVLSFTISCLDSTENFDTEWKLCTLLNKLLTSAAAKLSSIRNNIISGKTKNASDQLSHIVFQLCDVTINSSDNELRRWQIKANASGDNAAKTMEILMRNAKTLLTNALKISEKSCGMEENIVDKLKRNYIYNQAQARVSMLTSPKESDTSQISELVAEHPFYNALYKV